MIRLSLPMPVERIHADPHVKADVGLVALQRGPIVYCLEDVDIPFGVKWMRLPPDSKLTAVFEKDRLGGVTVLRGKAQSMTKGQMVEMEAVPYSTWDNRKPGAMAVWLPEDMELAQMAALHGYILYDGIGLKASHVFARDSIQAIRDGILPKSSNDHSVPRMTWWDGRGSRVERVGFAWERGKVLKP